MSDHSKPEANPTLVTVWDETTDRLNDLEKWNDADETSVTNPPTNAKRWNPTSNQFEEYDGATWNELSTTYNLSSAEITSTGLEVSGNVGIGESSPQDLLHIKNSSAGSNAGLRLENDEQTWALYCRGFDSDKFKIQDIDADTSPFAIETAAPNNTLYLDSSGNVGIGTSSPARKVTLYEDSSNESFLHFANSTTGVTSNDGAHIGLDNNEDLQISLLESGKLIEFYNNGNQAMVIDSSGNVGIGTSDTTTHLDGTTGLTIYHSTSPGLALANSSRGYLLYNSGSDLAFYDSTANATRMLLDSAGGLTTYQNIGIGGSNTTNSRIDIVADSALQGVAVAFNDTNASGRTFSLRSDAGSLALRDIDAGADRFAIDSNGDPYFYLNEDVEIQGDIDASVDINVRNSSTGTNASCATVLVPDGNNFIMASYNDNHSSRAGENWLFSTATGSDVVFGTNATERMRLLAGGNLGIGTSSPSNPLEVREDGTGTPKILIRSVSSGDPTISFLSDSKQFTMGIDDTIDRFAISEGSGLGSSDRLVIDSSGNLGIGTSSPSDSLEVKRATTGTAFSVTNSSDVRAASMYVDQSQGGLIVAHDNAGTNKVFLSSYSDSYFTGGNLGIGTSSPSNAKLWVSESDTTYSANSDSPLVVEKNGHCYINILSAAGGQGGLLFGDSDSDVGWLVYDHSDDSIRFGADATERMRIDSDGKVGIGNSSPYHKLDLYESTSGEVQMTFQNSTTGTVNAGLMIGITSTEMAEVWNYEATALRFGTNNTERMRIDYLGNVGIGTSSISSCALLELNSAGKGVLFPRMTTVQRDNIPSPAAGLVIFNTTTTKLECYDGSTWQAAW